jgi:glycosyltransferase involved in cell wall biosynthesis
MPCNENRQLQKGVSVRVLLVNSHLIPRGGDWTYISILSGLLQQHGHEVLLYGLAVPGSQTTLPFSELVPDMDFKLAFAQRSPRDILRVLSRTVYSFEAKRSIQHVVEKYKPTIVHLNNIHHFLTPSIVWPVVGNGIPIVWTLHDYTIICPNTTFLSHQRICESCSSGKFYACVLKRCKRGSIPASALAAAEAYCHRWLRVFDRVSTFVAPSSYLKNKFVEQGFPEAKVVHVANPIPASREYRGVGSQGAGLYIGRLSEEKGVETLVKALAGLRDIPFDIVGDGPLRARLEGYCNQESLTGIRFHGSLPTASAAEAVRNCKFVVVPSEWYENCPYAVLEALQNSKAVIASAIGGLPEIVQDQKNGILCPAGDVNALKQAIELLTRDSALCEKMGREGAHLALLHHDVETYYERIFDVYSKAIENGS